MDFTGLITRMEPDKTHQTEKSREGFEFNLNAWKYGLND